MARFPQFCSLFNTDHIDICKDTVCLLAIPAHQTMQRMLKKSNFIYSAILNDHLISLYTDTSCHFMLSYMGGLHKNSMFSEQTVVLTVCGRQTSLCLLCIWETHLHFRNAQWSITESKPCLSLWNVWYVLAPASDFPQSISWSPLEPLGIKINNELKREHQL